MRSLNEFEKRIISRLTDENINTLTSFANIFDPELENVDIFLDYTRGKVEVKCDEAFYTTGTILDVVRYVSLKMIITVNLLNYLQSNGYIAMFHEAPKVTGRFGGLVQGGRPITASIYDLKIEKLILDYSFKSILVQQPLIDYVDNKFKTSEEINTEKIHKQHKVEVRIALGALIVSIVLCAIETCIGIEHVKEIQRELRKEHVIKINDTEFNEIDQKINKQNVIMQQQNTELDSLSKQLKKVSGKI